MNISSSEYKYFNIYCAIIDQISKKLGLYGKDLDYNELLKGIGTKYPDVHSALIKHLDAWNEFISTKSQIFFSRIEGKDDALLLQMATKFEKEINDSLIILKRFILNANT